ncbi:signal recognition particle-docking protein FtsY [Candidatus Woesearchaeota archaeon CG10_big_fil_rev_8_21_14_0_10_34_8]|nr:MAG: signal recognition particle-docking protein FtsY [Candidatus Woesearchaeota archaeon CG10_big_fil_rev_8_21_14_0_10_34_8]
MREEKEPEPVKEKPILDEEPEEKGGIFAALKDTIFKTSISEEKFEELFWDLEVVLLENNVAVEVIDLIKTNLKKELVQKKILRGKVEDIIIKTLQKSVDETFSVPQIDFIKKVKEKQPFVIVFVGINGSGKTTTIAKMVQKLKDNKLSCVIAAADTFRAAAIQQLEEHANKLKVKMIKHDYGSDPAAVGFDAIKYAKAHNVDCVLIDTAGRLHSNTNLMDEMKKIIRVTNPDLKLFIGEAITGNDCVEQARRFNETIGIDGIILAKADVDDKGGAALSVSYVTQKPILYFGTGQEYKDLEAFDKGKMLERLGLA